MAIRKTAAAKVAALVPVNAAAKVDVTSPSYDRADMIKRLASANAKDRTLLLSGLPMGEVAAIGGIVGTIGTSVNEVLAVKLAQRHGNDWAKIAKSIPSELCDTDKERRKAILQSLESIRETVKANSGGNDAKARDTLRRVKEWGLGIRQSKSTPKGNQKAPIRDFLVTWEALPAMYRRICNDEGSEGAEMELATAIAAYFKSRNVSAKAVLECKGASEWTPPAA